MSAQPVPAEPAAAAPAALLTSVTGGVLTMTLNRPHVLNAITPELLDSLGDALRSAGADDAIRAVVITGSGRGFCSGQDLRYAAQSGNLDVQTILRDHYAPAIRLMRTLEKPIIAAVNGVAAGAGFSLALAADFRIAAESATFVQAFVRIGLVPDMGSTYFLPRLIGMARATELAMLGDMVPASRALDLGLVNAVVPDGRLAGEAAELAARLARGPRSIGLIKRALEPSLTNELEAQLEVEATVQGEATTTADFFEGVGAFLGKRTAQFTGR